jgi:tetraacyldisaccharide 4'-kinase
VGNLTVGGTGKTPTVIALGELLQKRGYVVSVLLRGYKGSHSGGPLLVSDGKSVLASSQLAGDEALVIAKNLPAAIVTVCKDRSEAGRWVERHFSANVHLLDDGFQHFRLYRDLNLLLIDVTDPFGGNHLLPLGGLREPLAGVRRADAVLLTRTQPCQDYEDLVDRVRSYKPAIPCFRVTQKLVVSSVSRGLDFVGLEYHTALAFAGIANPAQFFDSLRKQGMNLAGTMSFPDHHRYRTEDLERIKAACRNRGIGTVVTTEKDLQNLDDTAVAPLHLVAVRVLFELEGTGGIEKMILAAANKIAS